MKKILILLLSIAFSDVFGQAKISQLPTTTTLTGTELVPVVQSGVTKQTTASQIASLAISTIPSSVLTTSGSQSVSNKSGNISQWTNDAGYLTSSSASVYVPYSGANSFTTSNNITMGQLITNTIAAKASDSLSFYTNAIERLKIKSDGTFRFLSTSSTNTASGSMWYNVSSGTGSASPTGFTFYNPSNTFAEKAATFRNQTTGIQILLSSSASSISGRLMPMRNNGIALADSAGNLGLRVDPLSKVVINPASTGTHVANLTVLGTQSISSTFTVAGVTAFLNQVNGTTYNASNRLTFNAGDASIRPNNTGYGLRIFGYNSMSGVEEEKVNIQSNRGTTGANYSFSFTPTSFTNQTASTEAPAFVIGTATVGHATGAISNARDFVFSGITHSAIGASILTNQTGAQFNSPIAGTNVTLTNPLALHSNGNFLVTGTMSVSSTASIGGLNIISGGYSVTTKGINTTSGDAATINSPIGRFRKDNSGSSFTLTNSQITANSIIVLTLVSTGITTGYQMSVQAGSGSAVITFETAGVATAPSADCDVNFMIMN